MRWKVDHLVSLANKHSSIQMDEAKFYPVARLDWWSREVALSWKRPVEAGSELSIRKIYCGTTDPLAR